MKRIIFIFTLIAVTGLPTVAQDKPKVTEAAKTPLTIAIPEAAAKELQSLYQDAQFAEITFQNAKKLLTDDSGCVKQSLSLLEKDAQAKAGTYTTRLLATRITLDVPKDFLYNSEKGLFEAPKK